jgi:hypothetical protein
MFMASVLVTAKTVSLPDLVNPGSIRVDKSQIYITDGTSILIYGLEDFKLKKKFGKKGEGPEELMDNPQMGMQIRVDVQTDDIIVINFGKLSVFSKQGEFKKVIKVKGMITSLKPLEGQSSFAGMGFAMEAKGIFRTINIYDAELNKVTEIFKVQHDFLGPGKGLKVLTVPVMFATYDNKIFVPWDVDFKIHVFDSKGKKLQVITQKYDKREVAGDDKDKIINFFKTNPATKANYQMMKPILVPSHYPAMRSLDIAGGKLYILTYKKKGDDTELFVLDTNGKLLKKTYVPVAELDILKSYVFTFQGGKFFQLVDTEDEKWELRVTRIE